MIDLRYREDVLLSCSFLIRILGKKGMYGVVGYYYYCSVHPTNSYLIARMHSLNMYVRSKYCRSTYAAKHQHVGQDRNQQKKKKEKRSAPLYVP